MKNPMLTLGAALCLAPAALAPSGSPLEEATKAFQAGQYLQVLELAGALDTESPDYARMQYLAGETQLVLDAPEEAAGAFRRVLARRPEALPARIGLGRALTTLGQGDEALTVLDAALEQAPGDSGALVAHALLLSTLGQDDLARGEVDRAWKADPRAPLSVRAYVEVLLRAEDGPAAAAVVEDFMERRPEHPLGPFLMAWIMERDGEDELAIASYQQALELDPSFLDAHKNLAILCHTLSNTYRIKERVELAYEHYRRYFELGGRDQELHRTYEQLLAFKDQILGS